MKRAIEFHILDYLGFSEQESLEPFSWLSLDEPTWMRGLEFADTAGLALHLRGRLIRHNDWQHLPASIQSELEQRHRDNLERTNCMLQEFVELNRRLQEEGIRYLNLKGFLLVPDFVDSPERRVQYDYDFLVEKRDLQRAYKLFLRLGYSALHPIREAAADHFPPLIQKTGWQWKGNYYDPAIPRGVELHFQLWNPDFDLLPIQTLSEAWDNSRSQAIGSIQAPTLSHQDTLLYLTLHAFRHLLRNDLRLSHLYEIAAFLYGSSCLDDFWEEFLARVSQCPNTRKMVATTFELVRLLFRPVPSMPVQNFIGRHLPMTAASWLRAHGSSGAIHCYRKNRNALLLHLSLLDLHSRWTLVRKRLLPRHLPLPTYGVQIPPEAQTLKFRMVKKTRYIGLLLRRALFHIRALAELLFQLPFWLVQTQWGSKDQGENSTKAHS